MLRYIYDKAASAAVNMAIDELLFDLVQKEPVLRIYFWDKAYTTIGYFQKNECSAVRRLTGGLTVNHQNDLSYGFCAGAEEWPYAYDQRDTYKHIHTAIKKALQNINIKSSFAEIKQTVANAVFCVQTLYDEDLILDGKKIVGSCMRRRGKKILVQGSLHLNLETFSKEIFSDTFAINMAEILNTGVKKDKLTEDEIKKAYLISEEKYSNAQWNNKF
ncbi:MAG: hypothetical protein LBL00_04490 [Endomicrobium sp.]|jgi:lipoate-protein ligase A|nr:hypothetical protein [Endomicrobium sp.]